jgi:hypothetical protein
METVFSPCAMYMSVTTGLCANGCCWVCMSRPQVSSSIKVRATPLFNWQPW